MLSICVKKLLNIVLRLFQMREFMTTLWKKIYIWNFVDQILIICSNKFYIVAWMKNKGIEIGWERKRVYENKKTYGMSNKSLSQLRKATLSYFRRFFFYNFRCGAILQRGFTVTRRGKIQLCQILFCFLKRKENLQYNSIPFKPSVP